MKSVASGEADILEVVRKDGVGQRRHYLGVPGEIIDGPQAFLVELPYAGARVEPHFHDIDQFQVIVAGDGRIGKKQIAPVTFQYADAFTPYGPIVANDDGISFFTLRNVASGGHFKMPGSKHLMPCRAGRNIAGAFDADDAPMAENEVVRQSLMEPQDDGVHAWRIRLGAGARTDGLPSGGGGQYYLICAGSLRQDGDDLSCQSLIHVEPGEAAPALYAGAEGADILAVQFARPSQRPGSDPDKLAARVAGDYVHRTP